MTYSWRRPLVFGVVAALFAAQAGAQKLEIKTNKAKDANFKAIRTYAWLPAIPAIRNVAPDAVTNPTLSQEALGPHIIAAVDRQLAARGLVQAAQGAADVHVAYFAALTVGFSQTYLGEYYGYVTGWGSPIPAGIAPSTSSDIYEKGTVLIDVIDPGAKRAIWRGAARTRVSQEYTLEKRIERINEATSRMFKDFPIPPQKK